MLLRVLVVLLAVSPAVWAADPPPKPSAPPKAPPQQAVDATQVPPDLADWTPRPAVGLAEPWEKATDKDWIDGRFRQMNTGPFLNATFRYPHPPGHEKVYKGTAIRLGANGEAGVIFDRLTCSLVCGWSGGYLQHSDRRFGLLNTPTPKGQIIFTMPAGPGWAGPNGTWQTGLTRYTAPLPKEWARYRGLHLHADRVVLEYTVGSAVVYETHRADAGDDGTILHRQIQVLTQAPQTITLAMPAQDRLSGSGAFNDGTPTFVSSANLPGPAKTSLRFSSRLDLPRSAALPDDFDKLLQPGPARWGEPLVTDLVRGEESGPFAVDTLTLPSDNPFKALLFCTGLDVLPDGRIAVCTCHGDVWLARIDEAANKVYWQRFATGLYQPLGLKVVEGQVVVLERGQLTRLHDLNGDGEADFYECLNNDWHCSGGEHSYDTCLETDPDGNFYFFKTGDTDTPHGGCLMKVAKDGSTCEVVCTGFRHPISLGISPTGIITGADQEGNWMPATRIDQYQPGGFYGDMRAHHRQEPPTHYDGPLCWLPREVDNSAGGQVWVPDDSKWPLAGLPLHLSYGRCKAFVLLRQELPDGTVQGGVADLRLRFLSGVCRGRFHPIDGHLYVCGLNGWQTAAQADGCLQRVRYTGQPLDLPVKMEVVADGVKLTFSRPLDRAQAANPANYRAAWWNYKWTGDYGSKRYRLSDGQEGQDDVPITGVEVSEDGRTVRVKVGPVRPVMQMQLGYNVAATDGAKVSGSVYLTVHQAR